MNCIFHTTLTTEKKKIFFENSCQQCIILKHNGITFVEWIYKKIIFPSTQYISIILRCSSINQRSLERTKGGSRKEGFPSSFSLFSSTSLKRRNIRTQNSKNSNISDQRTPISFSPRSKPRKFPFSLLSISGNAFLPRKREKKVERERERERKK